MVAIAEVLREYEARFSGLKRKLKKKYAIAITFAVILGIFLALFIPLLTPPSAVVVRTSPRESRITTTTVAGERVTVRVKAWVDIITPVKAAVAYAERTGVLMGPSTESLQEVETFIVNIELTVEVIGVKGSVTITLVLYFTNMTRLDTRQSVLSSAKFGYYTIQIDVGSAIEEKTFKRTISHSMSKSDLVDFFERALSIRDIYESDIANKHLSIGLTLTIIANATGYWTGKLLTAKLEKWTFDRIYCVFYKEVLSVTPLPKAVVILAILVFSLVAAGAGASTAGKFEKALAKFRETLISIIERKHFLPMLSVWLFSLLSVIMTLLHARTPIEWFVVLFEFILGGAGLIALAVSRRITGPLYFSLAMLLGVNATGVAVAVLYMTLPVLKALTLITSLSGLALVILLFIIISREATKVTREEAEEITRT